MKSTIRAKLSSKSSTKIVFWLYSSYPLFRYALNELQKDVEAELQLLPESERDSKRTKFAVFVVHNKLKPKLGKLPPNIP